MRMFRAYPKTRNSSFLRRRGISHTASSSSLDFQALGWALIFLIVGIGLTSCSHVEKQKRQNIVFKKVQEKNEVWSYCYKKAMQKDQQDLEGELELSWRIDYLQGSERVSDVAVDKSTVRSEALVNCMKNAIARTRFDLPRDKGSAVYRVQHPFVFKNDKEMSVLKR